MDSPDLEQLTADELWQRGASALRAELADATWTTWFQGVHPVEHHDDVLVLGVPSSVACERIRSSYAGLLTDTLRDATGHEVQVEFVVTPVDDEPDPELDLEVPLVASGHGGSSDHGGDAGTNVSDDGGGMLKPRYRFKDFVIGTSNRFAHAAAMSVAEAPAQSYNPLFIYGPAGLGKTHLLHAIGHEVQTVFPAKRVRYVSTETFMNEFVNAIQTNTTAAFKRRYRDLDVLLIDDIQFLERSQQLQEEFFHTFNQLHQANGQIVMSSDRPPKSISEIEARLRSRFAMGLITDVQPPEFETRLAILRMRADAEHLSNVPDEVLAFIATNIHDNVRELEGALTRVAAYSRLNGATLSEEIARQVLADLLPPDEPRVITPELILDETAKMFGWTVEDLCGKSRRRPLVTARQIGMYVFRELTDYSYPRIAEAFGGRDHTTVMYAVEKIKVQMAERHVIFEQVNELISRIKLGTGG